MSIEGESIGENEDVSVFLAGGGTRGGEGGGGLGARGGGGAAHAAARGRTRARARAAPPLRFCSFNGLAPIACAVYICPLAAWDGRANANANTKLLPWAFGELVDMSLLEYMILYAIYMCIAITA
jgi:hypothetical protein